jgi:cell division inhibitor SepF
MFAKLAEKINRRLKDADEDIEFKKYEEERPAPKAPAAETHFAGERSSSAAISSAADSNLELKLAQPESYGEVSDIADYLLEGCTVVLNLEALEKPEALRMLDFLNGVTYTTGGDIKPVAQNTYIITPNNVDVNGQK